VVRLEVFPKASQAGAARKIARRLPEARVLEQLSVEFAGRGKEEAIGALAGVAAGQSSQPRANRLRDPFGNFN